jgi:hypothetical protein
MEGQALREHLGPGIAAVKVVAQHGAQPNKYWFRVFKNTDLLGYALPPGAIRVVDRVVFPGKPTRGGRHGSSGGHRTDLRTVGDCFDQRPQSARFNQDRQILPSLLS